MISPSDLSQKDLKEMHKVLREKYKCAKDNKTKGEASIVLSMLDDEFNNRGYDVTKLFKGYSPQERGI